MSVLEAGGGQGLHPLCLSLLSNPMCHVKGLNKGVGEARGSDERRKNFLKSGLGGHLVITCDDIKNNNHSYHDRTHSMPDSELAGKLGSSHCRRQLSKGVTSNEIC